MFKSENIVGTPAALDKLAELGLDYAEFLDRHFSGDWGDVDPDDAAQNDAAAVTKGMVLSAYPLFDGTELWIITDNGHQTTTVMMPEDY